MKFKFIIVYVLTLLAVNQVLAGEGVVVDVSDTIERVDILVNRAMTVDKESAENIYLEAEIILDPVVSQIDSSSQLYARMALVNAQLASYGGSKDNILRVQKIDKYSRKAIALDSSNTIALVIYGIMNYRLSNLSWFEKLIANTFIADLPEASMEESIKYLSRAIQIYDKSPYTLFALGRTYRAMDEDEKAIHYLVRSISIPAENEVDRKYQKRAQEYLDEYGD